MALPTVLPSITLLPSHLLLSRPTPRKAPIIPLHADQFPAPFKSIYLTLQHFLTFSLFKYNSCAF